METEDNAGRSRSISFDENDDDEGDGEPTGRGRGRSGAFDDDVEDGSGVAAAGAGGPAKKSQGTALSKKTLSIVNDLQGQGGVRRSGRGRLSPEEQEETRLAEVETQRRHAGKPGEGANGNPSRDDKAEYDHYIKILLLGDSGAWFNH